MPDFAIQIIVVLGLIGLNGIFSMAEMAVVAAKRPRLEQNARDGHHGAKRALELSENPNRFLSTVQVGITSVGILAGTYGGATLADPLADVLRESGFLTRYSGAVAIFIVVSGITFLTLILGELVPKRIALNRPEHIAASLSRLMHWLSVLTMPIVHVLSATTEAMLRIFGIKHVDQEIVTEEEIDVLLEQGARTGVIEVAEHEILERVFRFADQTIASFMTPRTDVSCIEITDPMETVREKLLQVPHSQLVVCKSGLDNPVGILDIRRIVADCITSDRFDLEKMLLAPQFVPESAPALRVLERFRQTGEQAALVVDEYGGVAGVVTLSEILEAFVGEIAHPGQALGSSIVQRADGSWLVDGLITSEEFKDEFDIRELPGEDSGHFRTLGGFVVNYFGRIPFAGDVLEFGPFTIEVVDMDGNRVDKVLVTRRPEETTTE